MGKVTYSPGIEYVNGALAKPKKKEGHKCGDYLIGTHRVAATTNPDCTRIYIRKGDAYERSTKPGADELANRNRFTSITRAVATRSKDLNKISQDQQAFLAQRNEPGGVKTLKAWYWKVEGDAYDQAHPGN